MTVSHGLMDPRGGIAVPVVDLAPRLRSLDGARLLLVDNGKLAAGYGPYAVIFDALKDVLPEAAWSLAALDLLRYTDGEADALASVLIGEHRPQAVLFALADAGITVQTVLLAVALEKRGVPAVILATPLGAGVARPIINSHAPGIPVVVLETERTDTPEDVHCVVQAQGAALSAALTGTPRRDLASGGELFRQDAREAAWEIAGETLGDFQDWLEERGLGDGLPLLPPSRRAVEDLLAAVPDDPEEVIHGPALTSGRSVRVRDAAVNAAMTACPPKAFPVVVAALRAMAHPDFRLSQAAITTHPSGYAVVLAGCDPARFGLSGGAGCLGPGHRGNASAGRAVALTVRHAFGAQPGGADLTIFGSPAEFTYCFAEDRQGVAWSSLADDFGDGAPGVYVLKAEGPRNILEHLALTPQGVCEALAGAAASICSNNAHIPGDLLVMVNPEHARIFTSGGWSREDLAQAIHERARLPRSALEGRCVGPLRPAWMDTLDTLPVTRSPRDVRVVVAGASGPQSMVALPWGYSRGQWCTISTR